MKRLLSKYKHGAFFLYILIYLPLFFLLEKNITEYSIIHVPMDDYIPFNEYFILPYDIWFLYIGFTYIFLFFISKEDFIPTASILTIGMSIFLLTSFIYPNGLPTDYRPDLDALGRDNFCIQLVRKLYASDTSTNVFPSIHVFNSLGATLGLWRCKHFPKPLKILALILCILICASTLFLKQHSVIDLFGGIVLMIILYPIYRVIENRMKPIQ